MRKTAQAVTTGDVVGTQDLPPNEAAAEQPPENERAPTESDISSQAGLHPPDESDPEQDDNPYDLRNEPPPHTPPPRQANKDILGKMRRGES